MLPPIGRPVSFGQLSTMIEIPRVSKALMHANVASGRRGVGWVRLRIGQAGQRSERVERRGAFHQLGSRPACPGIVDLSVSRRRQYARVQAGRWRRYRSTLRDFGRTHELERSGQWLYHSKFHHRCHRRRRRPHPSPMAFFPGAGLFGGSHRLERSPSVRPVIGCGDWVLALASGCNLERQDDPCASWRRSTGGGSHSD